MTPESIAAMVADANNLPAWRDDQTGHVLAANVLAAHVIALAAEVQTMQLERAAGLTEMGRLDRALAASQEECKQQEARANTWQMSYEEAIDVLQSRLNKVASERDAVSWEMIALKKRLCTCNLTAGERMLCQVHR